MYGGTRPVRRGRNRCNPVCGYREEPDVAPDSNVETYAALKLAIDNWRWAGVPFYLRTGKRLAKRKSLIAIRFKEVPHALFRGTAVTKSSTELARNPGPAGGRNFAGVRGQNTRPNNEAGRCLDGFQVSGLLWGRAFYRI